MYRCTSYLGQKKGSYIVALGPKYILYILGAHIWAPELLHMNPLQAQAFYYIGAWTFICLVPECPETQHHKVAKIGNPSPKPETLNPKP